MRRTPGMSGGRWEKPPALGLPATEDRKMPKREREAASIYESIRDAMIRARDATRLILDGSPSVEDHFLKLFERAQIDWYASIADDVDQIRSLGREHSGSNRRRVETEAIRLAEDLARSISELADFAPDLVRESDGSVRADQRSLDRFNSIRALAAGRLLRLRDFCHRVQLASEGCQSPTDFGSLRPLYRDVMKAVISHPDGKMSPDAVYKKLQQSGGGYSKSSVKNAGSALRDFVYLRPEKGVFVPTDVGRILAGVPSV